MELAHYLTTQHRSCDAHFASAEQAVSRGEWQEAIEHYKAFKDETLLHFQREEEVLFRAFEEATGITEGPTQVMRMEHAQILSLLEKIDTALDKQDKQAFFSLAESMMILLQQHNMKEEQMLYPMCDMRLPQEAKAHTLEKMQRLE